MRRIGVLAAFLASLWAAPAAQAHPLSEFSGAAARELRAARLAAEKGDWAGAASAAHRAGDASGPQMARWLRLQDERAADFDAAAEWLSEHRGWPAETAIRRVAERKIPADTPPAKVVAFFGGAEPLTARGALSLADALLALRRGDEAAAVVARAWAGLVFSEAEERDLIARYGAALPPGADEARLDRLLWDGRLSEAQRLLPRANAEARRLAEARLALLRGQDQANGLLAALPAALRAHPGIAHGRMVWRNGRGMVAEAQAMLSEATRDGKLGVPERWAERRRIWSRQAWEAGAHRRAFDLASPHGISPGGDQAELDWFAGWMALRHTGDLGAARRLFGGIYETARMPISRARGAYWAGEAAARAGDAPAARTWRQRAAAFSTTFYGQLAATKLGGAPVDGLRAPAAPGGQSSAPPADWREAARMGFAIAASGDARRAQEYFGALARGLDEPALRSVGQAALDAELWGLGVAVGKQALTKGVLLPNASYPLAPLPARTGCGSQVEPAFIYAIIRQESEFNAAAVSRAGARGLMQLMPPTAREVGRVVGAPSDNAALTGNPDANIRLGACYLERVLDQFDGSVVLAAAAYNAGPGRARQWIGALGDPRAPGVDPVDWIESIPFSETRNYVQRVVEGYYVYRFRLGEPAPEHRLAQR